MNFELVARTQEYKVEDLEKIIRARHGDAIENLTLYREQVGEENLLSPLDWEKSLAQIGAKVIMYDYYPPYDPFRNRPTAGELASTNPSITLATQEGGGEPTIDATALLWSKTAEHHPQTVKRMAAEAEAARLKAEAEAKAEAERIEKLEAEKAAKAKARAEEKARQEAIRKKKEAEEEAARKEAEERRRKAEEEAAAKDPKKQAELAKKKAEEEAARKKAEAEAALAALPPRKKGGAVGLFLGSTTQEYYGLDKCDERSGDLYRIVACEEMLKEITDKGKIADLYDMKPHIEKYEGDPKEMLICKDEQEVYGDNGWVMCLHQADKEHFIAHIAAGNGLPPPL
jgi:flagellar biosynthesis GTPase FlhF